MKINPGYRSIPKELSRTDTPAHSPLTSKPFSDMMQQQEHKSSHDQLRRMLEQIDMQGQRLAKSMTVRELRAYRQMVKKFLDDTVRRGITMKDTKGWDRRGRGKRYKIIDEIDRSLVELGDHMLENEQGRLEVLGRIGEIRGLLINLIF